jgi:two-component system osmolarity sensor histidine kinase EnvZ
MMAYLPRSLLGRNVALLLLTVAVSQIVAVTSFVMFLQRPRIQEAAGFFATQILIIDHALADVPDAKRNNYLSLFSGRSEAPASSQAIADVAVPRPFANIELHTFLHALSDGLPPRIGIRWQAGHPAKLWVHLSISGHPYWVPLPLPGTTNYPGLWIAILSSLLLSSFATAAALAIHRRINRPISQLLNAANLVGRGRWPAPVPEQGTTETIQLTRTFNEMTERLAEIEATRAAMLAGISHDIRTPLTKLQLALAMYAPSPEKHLQESDIDHCQTDDRRTSRPQVEHYIEDINAILQQFIDFARGTQGEPRRAGNVNAVIEQLAADFSGLGYDFDLRLSTLPATRFGQTSLLRLFMNLMENAARYGQVGLAVSSHADASWIYVTVDDRGPGVPASFLPLMMQPFRRGEHTAGHDGSGLGLAIARQIAREHGGDITVSLRQRGGLSCQVRLSTESI